MSESQRVRAVVVVGQKLGGRQPATRLHAAFERMGYESRAAEDGAVEAASDVAVLLWGNVNWFPRTVASLISTDPARRPVVALWQSEPLPFARTAPFPNPRLTARELAKIVLRDSRATDAYTNARRLERLARHGLPDVTVVTSLDKAEFLQERGLRCDAVLVRGYDESLGDDLGLERDLDVLFLGALVVRRRRRIVARLRRLGIEVHAAGSWTDPAYWGEERTKLLNRTRILLNLSRFPGQFSGERLVLGMANGALVVSEPMYRPEPFVPGSHFVSASLDDMPEVIARYLADESSRAALARQGHDFVERELRLDGAVREVLRLLEERMRSRAR